jgi:hypothetical protein
MIIVIGCFIWMAASTLSKRIGLDFLIWWPIIMYIPGPIAAYLLFGESETFANYISAQSVLVSTLVLVGGFALYRLFLGKRLADILRFDLAQIESSPAVIGAKWPLVALGCLCAATQILLIRDTGASLLSNEYVLGGGRFSENRTLFTLTAGLYEMFAALFALRLVSVHSPWRRNKLLFLFAAAVVALRMLGGTRLVVLKLVVFVVLVRMLQRRISKKAALVSAIAFSAFLMIVGSLRGSAAEEGSNILFLLFAEPALGNLSATFVTDYYLNHGIAFNPNAITDTLGYIVFVAIHLLPNAIYQALGGDVIYLGDWGYYRSWGQMFYPFRLILGGTGLETVSPVGGQSVVSLGVALFGYAGAVLVIPLTYAAFGLLRAISARSLPVILVLGFEAPSIYREGAEIFVKQFFIILLVYWLFSILCRVPLAAKGSTGSGQELTNGTAG